MRGKCRALDSHVDPTNDELKRLSEITAEGLRRRARARGITLEHYVAWRIAEERETKNRAESGCNTSI